MVDDGIEIGVASTEDRIGVSRVLDGAVLAVEALPERLADGEVLVAVDDETICGAVVLSSDGPPVSASASCDSASDPHDSASDPHDSDRGPPAAWRDRMHLRAIAVRRSRRDRGIGTELVHHALERVGLLVADFDDSVRPFYESLETASPPVTVELEPAAEDRWWALLERA